MGWKQEAAAGGGVINDLASHVLDLADWLIGPVAEVQAESRILYPDRPNRRGERAAVEAEDAVSILARLRDGGIGVIEASKIATAAKDELRVEIHGDRGALRFNSMEPNHLEAYSQSDPEAPIGGMRGRKRIDTVHRYPKPAGWPGPKFSVGWLRSHVHCLYNFVAAVAEGRPTEPSLPKTSATSAATPMGGAGVIDVDWPAFTRRQRAGLRFDYHRRRLVSLATQLP
jgi:predicted dehydrogenase